MGRNGTTEYWGATVGKLITTMSEKQELFYKSMHTCCSTRDLESWMDTIGMDPFEGRNNG